MGLLCTIEEGSTIRIFSKTWHNSHINRSVLTSQTLPPKPSSSAPNSFPCSTTPNWRSMPRPRLSRSTTSRSAFKVLSTVRPQSLLLSNRNSRPGQPVDKPAQPWQNQIAQAKARLAQLERRSERVEEIAHDAGLYADSLLDEHAARKLRFHHPRRRHETEFKARSVPLLPRESAKKTFNVGDRLLPERHALFPRRIDAWRA